MIKDKVLTGILVGIFADSIKLTSNYLAYLFNFTHVVFWQITATQFLEKSSLFKPAAYLIGGVADLTVSALLGVAFVYFIHFVGGRNLWIKGFGFGLAVWVLLLGTLISQTVQQKLPQTPTGIIVTIVAHSVFGLALAFFTWWFDLRINKEASVQVTSRKVRKFSFTPVPARKQELKQRRVRLVKPKKL